MAVTGLFDEMSHDDSDSDSDCEYDEQIVVESMMQAPTGARFEDLTHGDIVSFPFCKSISVEIDPNRSDFTLLLPEHFECPTGSKLFIKKVHFNGAYVTPGQKFPMYVTVEGLENNCYIKTSSLAPSSATFVAYHTPQRMQCADNVAVYEDSKKIFCALADVKDIDDLVNQQGETYLTKDNKRGLMKDGKLFSLVRALWSDLTDVVKVKELKVQEDHQVVNMDHDDLQAVIDRLRVMKREYALKDTVEVTVHGSDNTMSVLDYISEYNDDFDRLAKPITLDLTFEGTCHATRDQIEELKKLK